MKPNALKPGDLIRLVSPASSLTAEKLVPLQLLLEHEGYRVEMAPHALVSDGFLAGTDEQRAGDLISAFEDPEVSAVLCTRGGYGCARLIPYLDFEQLAQNRKLFAGFSDITTLHLGLNRHGLPTLHSPMVLSLFYARDPWVYDSFLRSLKGDLSINPMVPNGETLFGGIARGVSTGGCMCLLTDSIGTAEALDATEKILFIEDVDEAPHRIDAMLTHLLNAGVLQTAAGIVFGEMTRTDQRVDSEIGTRSWQEIVKERTKGLNLPVIVNFPFGHAKNMLTLGLGIQVELNADLGTVTYLESLCA